MRYRSRDAGESSTTVFGRRVHAMESGMHQLQTARLADMWHLLLAVLFQVGATKPPDAERHTKAIEELAAPDGEAKCITHFEAEFPQRIAAADWMHEQAKLAFVEDIAVARDAESSVVAAGAEEAARAFLLLPQLTNQARLHLLTDERYAFAIRASRKLRSEVMLEFDTKVARIEATSFRAFRNAVNQIISYLHTPAERAARIRGNRGVHTEYTDSGEAVMTVRGPTEAIAVLDAKLDALARAVIKRQTSALGLPADTEVVDERTKQQLRFDLLTTSSPAGTVRTRRAVDAAAAVGLEAMKAVDGITPEDVEKLSAQIEALTTDLEISCPTDAPWLARHAKIIVTLPFLNLLCASTGEGEGLPGTINGHPVPADIATRLSGHGSTLTRMLTDPLTGQILDQAATTYQIPDRLRLLLTARWQTCTVPTCGRPASSAEIDHIEPFNHTDPAAGGRTVLENLHPVCKHHHQLKTDGALTAERDPDSGIIYWTFPSGRTYPSVPPPAPIDIRQTEEIVALIAGELDGTLINCRQLLDDAAAGTTAHRHQPSAGLPLGSTVPPVTDADEPADDEAPPPPEDIEPPELFSYD